MSYDMKYCYPETSVLINKLGIKSFLTLNEAERELTSIRVYDLENNPIKGDFNLKHLQDIHKYIFQDLYNWAGELRTVNIAKGNMFCLYNYIDGASQDIFNKLEKDKYLIGMTKVKFTEKLAYYFSEINAIHPFREGNGRTQREFIISLARVNGYDLAFEKINTYMMLNASIESFNGKYSLMEDLFKTILTPISKVEQREYIQNIIGSNNSFKREFNRFQKEYEQEM